MNRKGFIFIFLQSVSHPLCQPFCEYKVSCRFCQQPPAIGRAKRAKPVFTCHLIILYEDISIFSFG